MRHIVLGKGEVGGAIYEVLNDSPENLTGWYDINSFHVPFVGRADALHVCIPFSEKFVDTVWSYVKRHKPSLVIVHSTVPVGTCDENNWIHSPVRGVHPNIAKGIRTFVKYFGGLRSEEAAYIFSGLGIRTVAIPHARDCEAAKLWDTTQYGLMIYLEKKLNEWCKENNVNPDFVYREFNRTYNEGYAALGRREVARPFLKHIDGPIGGHCVIQNLPLLGDNEIAKLLSDFNNSLITKDLEVSGHIP